MPYEFHTRKCARTRAEQIRVAAEAGTPEFGPAKQLRDGAFAFEPNEQAYMLRQPLRHYGVPVAELYTGIMVNFALLREARKELGW